MWWCEDWKGGCVEIDVGMWMYGWEGWWLCVWVSEDGVVGVGLLKWLRLNG